MNTVLKIGAGAVATAVLVAAFVYFVLPDSIVGPAGKDGRDGVGAVAGNDFSTDTISIGGQTRVNVRVPMRPATTTLCAVKAPSATSSINYASFIVNVGTSTAATIDMATGTTAFATSTSFSAANSVGSGAQGGATWRPVGASVNDSTVAPNEYFLVKTAGAGLGGYTYTGYCAVEFLVR